MKTTKTHKELVRSWDTETLTSTIRGLKEHVSELKRDGEDFSKWQRRLDDCETELSQR